MKDIDREAIRILSEGTDDDLPIRLINILNDRSTPPITKKAAFMLITMDRDFSDDGGPGSGNWGHKGRPGLKGGSGKGGGKALRTGNAQTGFMSIKKDPAFADVVTAAKEPDYDAFKRKLHHSPAAWQALKDQHVACGTKEDIHAYRRRIYDMLRTAGSTPPPKPVPPQQHTIINGNQEGYMTFTRNPGRMEIEEAVKHQGYDGKPKLLSHSEFEAYRKAHGSDPLFFRAYNAPDKATLKQYDDDLEGGHFYVDCGTGGAQYGQGLYSVGCYDRTTDYWDGVKNEMSWYGTRFGSASRNPYHVRAFMLDPSAKIFKTPLRPDAGGGKGYIRDCLLDELAKRKPISQSSVYEKSDAYAKTQEYEDAFQEQFKEWDKHVESIRAEVRNGNIPYGFTTQASQFGRLDKMSQGDKEKMLEGFYREVYAERVKKVARKHPGINLQNARQWVIDDLRRQSTHMDELTPDELFGIAQKHTKTKQMALLLAKLEAPQKVKKQAHYWSPVYISEDRSWRKPLDVVKIINPNAIDARTKYKDMDPGALATLLGYDAINAHGHGRTGSYTVVLNRTKMILDKGFVDINAVNGWKG